MSSDQLHRITIEPGKCGGRPCIRGYRLRVSDVLDLLAAGVSERDILHDYDFLESGDIQACLQYAAAQSRHVQKRLEPLLPALVKDLGDGERLIEIG